MPSLSSPPDRLAPPEPALAPHSIPALKQFRPDGGKLGLRPQARRNMNAGKRIKLKKGNMKKIVGVLALIFLLASPALAHEKRAVGDYELVVGFVNEPAFSGAMNGIDLRVSKAGEPVEGLEETLKASVSYGDQPDALLLGFKRKYKDPGKYAAYFLPAKPGKYTFRITGKMGEVELDEVFASGEKFHDVEDVGAVTWPASGIPS